MAPGIEVRWLVLHALRLKGVAECPPLVAATGLDAGVVEAALVGLAVDGLIERRLGALPGWSATVLGRKHDDLEARAELEASGARASLQEGYRAFLAVNPELLAACTAWQLRPAEGEGGDARLVANDHQDSDYDAAVVDRLVTLHARAQPVLDIVVGALSRFASYRSRLAHALAQVTAGEADWFTRPLLDSYHSVWFELHQDLLTTLGLDRGDDAVDRAQHGHEGGIEAQLGESGPTEAGTD